MFGIGRKFKSYFGGFSVQSEKRELQCVANQPKGRPGYTRILRKPFKFHDGASFAITYNEIFQNNIYQFNPSGTSSTILDCGANMGLSVVYFSVNYPEHHIIAFEPDPRLFEILSENVKSFELKNVTLYNKAVWDRKETLSFFTDNAMGGRVEKKFSGQEPQLIETVRLKDFVDETVDFLKIDIEGAEDTVLNDCADKLGMVNNIFFEYHNDVYKAQTLHNLLGLVKDQGFHYYIKESATRKSPFIDTQLICESFDMAINVFCYKERS